MSYTLGGKPLNFEEQPQQPQPQQTQQPEQSQQLVQSQKSDRSLQVQKAIASEESQGATEVKMAAEKTAKKKHSEAEKEPKGKALAEKVKNKVEKQKKKTHFPPGLVVSEKARAKMEEHQNKIKEKTEVREAKKAEQQARWAARPDVQDRWTKWEERQQLIKNRILAKWDEQDKEMAERNARRLAVLADKPERLEKEKEEQATEAMVIRLKRAKQMAYIEDRHLRKVKKREHSQVRRDKVYNFFGGFLGWEKRKIPEIPIDTLAEWYLNGWEI